MNKTIGTADASRVRLRPVALPGEHGGWSLLLEPIALALLVAPSTSGLFISLAAVFAFLTRHPLKLAISDRRKGRKTQRTVLAHRFVVLYLSLSIICFVVALTSARSPFLLPLLIAAPFVIIQFVYDATGRSRALWPELTGAVGVSAVVAAIPLSGGTSPAVALALWVLITLRAVPTILYVRTRIQRLRGKTSSSLLPLVTHVLAFATGVVMAMTNIAPWLAAAALLVLLIRAVIGLRSNRRDVQAKTIGLTELVFGVIFVVMVFVGSRGLIP